MLIDTLPFGSEYYSSWMTCHYTQAVLSSLLLCLGISYVYLFTGNDAAEIHTLRGFSIVNAWTFFNKRYDFLRLNFEQTGHDLFAFKFMQVSDPRTIMNFAVITIYCSTKS